MSVPGRGPTCTSPRLPASPCLPLRVVRPLQPTLGPPAAQGLRGAAGDPPPPPPPPVHNHHGPPAHRPHTRPVAATARHIRVRPPGAQAGGAAAARGVAAGWAGEAGTVGPPRGTRAWLRLVIRGVGTPLIGPQAASGPRHPTPIIRAQGAPGAQQPAPLVRAQAARGAQQPTHWRSLCRHGTLRSVGQLGGQARRQRRGALTCIAVGDFVCVGGCQVTSFHESSR